MTRTSSRVAGLQLFIDTRLRACGSTFKSQWAHVATLFDEYRVWCAQPSEVVGRAKFTSQLVKNGYEVAKFGIWRTSAEIARGKPSPIGPLAGRSESE